IDAGELTNSTLVAGTPPSGPNVTDESDTATDADGDDITDPAGTDSDGDGDAGNDPAVIRIEIRPSVALVVVPVNSGSGRNGAFVVGDEIEYRFTVTNRGNTTLSGFVLNDAKLGLKDVPVDGTLAPGESFVRM